MKIIISKHVVLGILLTVFFVLLGALRFTLPVLSAPVTPAATQKLSIYGGVVMLLANGSSVLEVGGSGRDLASNNGIAFRPGSTDEGSIFTGDPGYCSTDRSDCRNTADCIGGQSCVNNMQNLALTGDLVIGGQLCFNGLTDCRSTWPTTSSLIWGLNVNTLTPRSSASIRVGNSVGYCANQVTRACYDDLECPIVGSRKCLATSGVLTMDGFVVIAASAQPALSVSKSTAFGQSDVAGVPVQSGNVLVVGRMTVNTGIRVSVSPYTQLYPVWYEHAPTDTQDGSGIDADMIDGTTGLPYTTTTTAKNLFWKQYYVPPAGTNATSLTIGTGGDPYRNTLIPLLCLRTTREKVCSNGPKAGVACNLDVDCPAADTCAGGTCAIVTSKSCTVDGDCPSTTHTPTCAVLYTNTERQCTADNLWVCNNEPTRACLGDGDCTGGGLCQAQQGVYHCSENQLRACTTDQDCVGSGYDDGYCMPGQVVANVPAGACTQTSCDETCTQTVRCNGRGTNGGIYANADKFGTKVYFNKGECINDAGGNPTMFCRCSLNVRTGPVATSGKKYVPYLDATNQLGGGDICSGAFTDDTKVHPLP